MGKVTDLPTCEACGWQGKSHPAVQRHIGQKPRCAAKLLSTQNERISANLRPPAPPAQVNDPGPSNQPHEPAVAAPPLRRSPSVTLEEIEDESLSGYISDPPRRNPNAILEDADVFDAPSNPPRRNPNAILEDANEIEDEDILQDPPWGPHPFANPTRATLFPEAHPDPTAGAALRYYDVDREEPPKYTTPLTDPDTFREARWLARLPICRKDEAEYFSLPRVRDLKLYINLVSNTPEDP
ncbi:hypothetical protein FRC12_011394 [Ceratobasidium sp. 428]|nr:hypothetical protein FRC12_011394 [Ceratobasidium sp. 428]